MADYPVASTLASPLASPLDRALFLRTQPYFADLDAGVVALLARESQERFFRRGAWVLEEGRPADRILFLVEGRLRGEQDGHSLWEIEAPGGVGLAHLLAQTTRPPGFRAESDVLALEIEREPFMQILDDHFALTLEIARSWSHMIAALEHDEQLPELPPLPPVSSPPLPGAGTKLVDHLAFARRTPYFERTNLTILAELFRTARMIGLQAGQSLYEVGEPVDSIALILSGSILSEGYRLERLEAGELVGLWDLMTDDPRERSAIAETEARVVLLDRAHYVDLLEDHFDLACELLAILARRLISVQSLRLSGAQDEAG